MTGRPSVSFLFLSFRGFSFQIGSHEAQLALNSPTAEVDPKFLILLSPISGARITGMESGDSRRIIALRV